MMEEQVGGRSIDPHDLALEVGDGEGEVDIKHMVTLGHQQLQGKNVALMFQKLPHGVLENGLLGHLGKDVDDVLTLLAQVIGSHVSPDFL